MRFHIGLSLNWNTLKKWILPIFLGVLVYLGFSCLSVNAEEITPTTGYRAQVGSFNASTGDTLWNTSNIGDYNIPLYFTQGQDYYNFFIPGYIRLAIITDLNVDYTYRISYKMTIYELNISDWDISKIDNNYDLRVNDDSGTVKDYKCSVVSSDFIEGTVGNTIEKSITCTFNVNYNIDDAWLSSGYICKDCTLSGVEDLGTVTSDAYMYVTDPKLERFEDNSGIIIDQNDQIIAGQDQIKDEIGNVGDQIEDSIGNAKDEINDTIKDQFNSCRDSYNLLPIPSQWTYYASWKASYSLNSNDLLVISSDPGMFSGVSFKTVTVEEGKTYTLSIKAKANSNALPSFRLGKNTNNVEDIIVTSSTVLQNGYYYLTATFTADSSYKLNINFYPSYKEGNLENYTVTFYDFQLQEGSVATEYEPYGEEVCSNKLDDTNDQLGNLNDNLTNPDIDSGTGNSFFDNFKTEDNGGISGIITSPLRLINSLLDNQGTCTDLRFPIMGKEVAIPSGCIIWDKVPNEIEILIQTLVCGTGAYFLLKELFKDIEKLKNPNNSEVSTLDL